MAVGLEGLGLMGEEAVHLGKEAKGSSLKPVSLIERPNNWDSPTLPRRTSSLRESSWSTLRLASLRRRYAEASGAMLDTG